jgi:hypothetical protein
LTEHVDQMLLLRVTRQILLFEIADERLESFQFFGRKREHLAVRPWRVALSEARCFPSSVRGPVDFCAFRRLARSCASEGGRRMGADRLGDASLERDGSLAVLADGFFLEAMNEPLACEHRRQKQMDGRWQGGSH